MAVSKVILNGDTLIDVTQKTVTAGSMLSGTTALKNDGTDITGSIASKTSSDLTASGATVTAPAGYYASSASKSVAAGSATTPTTSITANPTISVSSGGLITASVSGSKSVTPNVSAGYVSSGTAGTVSVSGSNTEQLTTQAAQTIHPSTTDQSIASGKYLTGAQTIKAVTTTNLTAANIAEGVTVKIGDSTDDDCVASITGTHQGGTTPTGVKYVYSDVDGVNAYNVSGFEKVSVDYAGLSDNKFRLWVETTTASDSFSFSVNTGGIVYCHADWGDGSEEDFTSAGNTSATTVGTTFAKTISHTYVTAGRYCAVISSTGNLIGGIVCQNNNYLKGVEIASYISQWYSSNYFSGCANLESITFPASNTDTTTAIDASVCSALPSLKKVVFNSTASSVPSFADDTSLEEITLPATVGVISGFVSGCTSLRRVNGFENATITTLPQYSFRDCSSLLSITLPQSITTFANQAFAGASLKSIIIPSGVTNMGRKTFYGCSYLKEVHMLPTSPPTIYATADSVSSPFGGTHPDLIIYVPQGYLASYQSATNWSSFASRMQEESS